MSLQQLPFELPMGPRSDEGRQEGAHYFAVYAVAHARHSRAGEAWASLNAAWSVFAGCAELEMARSL
eukprot:3661675-Pyramimonas_sp.AAC.1